MRKIEPIPPDKSTTLDILDMKGIEQAPVSNSHTAGTFNTCQNAFLDGIGNMVSIPTIGPLTTGKIGPEDWYVFGTGVTGVDVNRFASHPIVLPSAYNAKSLIDDSQYVFLLDVTVWKGTLATQHICVATLPDILCNYWIFADLNTVDLQIQSISDSFYHAVFVDSKVLFFSEGQLPFVFDPAYNSISQWIGIPRPPKATLDNHVARKPEGDHDFKYEFLITYRSTFGSTQVSERSTVNLAYPDNSWFENTDYVTITRDTHNPKGMTAWDLYVKIEGLGSNQFAYRLNSEPLPVSQTSFTYNKQSTMYIDRVAPGPDYSDNTTYPIKFGECQLIDSRLWITKISEWPKGDSGEFIPNPYYRVAWSGIGREIFTFGATNGAGYQAIKPGSDAHPQAIRLFRKNSGDACITVLTGSADSKGSRYIMAPQGIQSVAYDANPIEGFVSEEQLATTGTVAQFSVIQAANNLFYLSHDAFVSTQTNANISGLLVNEPISGDISGLLQKAMLTDGVDIKGVGNDNGLFWLCNINNQQVILFYNLAHLVWHTIKLPDSMTIDNVILNYATAKSECLIELVIVSGNMLYYFPSRHVTDEIPIATELDFNSVRLSSGNRNDDYGRLKKAGFRLENADVGNYYATINGLDVDSVLKEYEWSSEEPADGVTKYHTLNIELPMYRENFSTDLVGWSLASIGNFYYLVAVAIDYVPQRKDYALNKFGRTPPSTTQTSNPYNWVLEQQGFIGKTQWLANAQWDDSLIWTDGD